MTALILTADQAKEARTTLNLSQGKVATDLGINRSYLSQFESGRRILDNSTLSKLREYYEDEGYDFWPEPNQSTERAGRAMSQGSEGAPIRVLDGFVVPPAFPDAEADEILNEYANNKAKIVELCGKAVPLLTFFDDYDEQALRYMARQYLLIEQLHGNNDVLTCDGEDGKRTVGCSLKKSLDSALGLGSAGDA